MTWILVLTLLHADGTVTTSEPVRFPTSAECESAGRAWAAQATRRADTDVAIYRCRAR